MKIQNYIIVTLSAFLLLSACKKEANVTHTTERKSESHASTPSIIGEWQTPGMQIVAFHEDRTMTITNAGRTGPGRYTLEEGNKIKIEVGDGTTTQTHSSTQTYSFKDTDTLMISSETSVGTMDEFRRITHK